MGGPQLYPHYAEEKLVAEVRVQQPEETLLRVKVYARQNFTSSRFMETLYRVI